MESLFVLDEIQKLTNKRYRIHNKYINNYISSSEYTTKIDKLLVDSEDLQEKLKKEMQK